MRLEQVVFKESVTLRGSQQTRIQTHTPEDVKTYSAVLQVADGSVWWSDVEGAPVENVREWRRAAAVNWGDVGRLSETTPIPDGPPQWEREKVVDPYSGETEKYTSSMKPASPAKRAEVTTNDAGEVVEVKAKKGKKR